MTFGTLLPDPSCHGLLDHSNALFLGLPRRLFGLRQSFFGLLEGLYCPGRLLPRPLGPGVVELCVLGNGEVEAQLDALRPALRCRQGDGHVSVVGVYLAHQVRLGHPALHLLPAQGLLGLQKVSEYGLAVLEVGVDQVAPVLVDGYLRLVRLGGVPLLVRLVTELVHVPHVLSGEVLGLCLGQALGEVGVHGLVEGGKVLGHVPLRLLESDREHRVDHVLPAHQMGEGLGVRPDEHGPHVLEEVPQFLVGHLRGCSPEVLVGDGQQPLGVLASQAHARR